MHVNKLTIMLAAAIQIAVGCALAQAGTASSLAEEAVKSSYPRFNWDHVPLYMHIRKEKAYTAKEIAFLARFPLITFEKANGHAEFGSVEKGTLAAARAVKQVNPDAKILYYRNAIVHYGGYAANEKLADIPGALLEDDQGSTKLVRGRVEAYDLSNPELRAWWVEACRSMAAEPVIDGIFVDGNVKALEPGYLAREIGAEKKRQVLEGYHVMMQRTREAIGPEKLMIANLLRARFPDGGLQYMHYFDGSYLEGFFHEVGGVSYEAYVAKGIETMQAAGRQGKIIAFTAGLASQSSADAMGIDEAHAGVQSDAQARAALSYPLALFLIAAEKYSYFRAHEGYSANEGDQWMRWLPEYDKPLGPPQGPAACDGTVYTRSFAHAKVWLDIGKGEGRITWE